MIKDKIALDRWLSRISMVRPAIGMLRESPCYLWQREQFRVYINELPDEIYEGLNQVECEDFRNKESRFNCSKIACAFSL